MIIPALDTGMRQGEMLALRFGDIDEKRRLLVLRGETTKSKKTRVVPVSTARLKAVLDWLRLDADNEKKPAEALVFSDEAGEPIGTFRTAWVTAVLKAHDITPEWRSYNWTALTPKCKEAFRRINLHWHDLRHEYASRLVERGVPLAQVRDLLGHASITTTERYDNQKLENLQTAVLKLESGKTFDPKDANDTKTRVDDPDKVSSFFQVQAKVPTIDDQKIDREMELNSDDANDLGSWLGGRDSNPDNVVQSHVSYR
jgi:integrase